MSVKFAENVTRSVKGLERAEQVLREGASKDDVMSAAEQAEQTVRWLQGEWSDKGFTPEQCVFALALVTINFRDTVPEKYGGKAMFDRIAAEARKYYDSNAERK